MRTVYPLNFGWKYSPDFRDEMLKKNFDDSAFETVDIPHTNLELPLNYFDEKSYQFKSCYRKHFSLDGGKNEGKRYILHFEGASVYSRVYLNGSFIGEYKGSYNRFSFDITDNVRAKNNVLAVELDSSELEDVPPFGNVVDYLVYGGIYREVWLEEVSDVYIEDVFVRPMNVLHEKKVIDADITLSKSFEGTLCLTLKDKDGVALSSRECAFKGKKVNIKWAVSGVKLWEPDMPELYTLEVKLQGLDEKSERFGFREARFKKDGFYLNGKKLKIRGLNRHQSYPYVGYAMPKNVQKADADLLKYKLGVNLVRTSHYPDSVHFLDRCDEIGLLVFTEIPSWQFLGEGEWREHFKDNIKRMIIRDRNHPSVILWGVRVNEGMDCDEFYKEANEIAHSLDSTRQTGGVRNIPRSHLFEDVFTYNDFSHSGGMVTLLPPVIPAGLNAPYLVTEHNGHMYPTKSFDREALRTEHALRHTRVLNTAYGNPRISGAIGWCMADYNTHKDFGSGDKICYHGVTDMFRVPKFGAAVYRSQQEFEPYLEVSSSMDIGEHPGGIIGKVWVFTNCDYVKLYKSGKYTSTIYPKDSPFKNLPHPPMLAEDFFGDALTEVEKIDPKAAKYLKEALVAAQRDQIKMPPQNWLKVGAGMALGKLSISRMYDLVTKYIGGWGDKQVSYTFEGYKDGKLVKTIVKSAVTGLRLEVKADSTVLKEDDTYDATRIEILALDQNGNRAPFADSAVKVSIKGPAEIIGPKEFPLVGGDRAFWIRTVGKKGDITVTVNAENIGKAKLDLKAE